jgi:hypothetical protein
MIKMRVYKVSTQRYTDNFFDIEPIGYYSTRKSAVEFMSTYLNAENNVHLAGSGEFICLELEELDINENRIEDIVGHLNCATAEQWNYLSNESQKCGGLDFDSVTVNPAVTREIDQRKKERDES